MLFSIKKRNRQSSVDLYLSSHIPAGAYILENTHPLWGGEYQPMSFGGKI
jgi:hypothetical protein